MKESFNITRIYRYINQLRLYKFNRRFGYSTAVDTSAQKDDVKFNYYDINRSKESVRDKGLPLDDPRRDWIGRDDSTQDYIDLDFREDCVIQKPLNNSVFLFKKCKVTGDLVKVEMEVDKLSVDEVIFGLIYNLPNFSYDFTVKDLYLYLKSYNLKHNLVDREALISIQNRIQTLLNYHRFTLKQALTVLLVLDNAGLLVHDVRNKLLLSLQSQLHEFNPCDIAAAIDVYGKIKSRYGPFINILGLVFYDLMLGGKTSRYPDGVNTQDIIIVLKSFTNIKYPIKKINDVIFGTLYERINELTLTEIVFCLKSFFKLSKDPNFVEFYTKAISIALNEPLVCLTNFETYTMKILNENSSSIDNSPPEVTSPFPLGVEPSSNYLSLKSKVTPGDRGGREGGISTGPQVEPVADLLEAKGKVNRRGSTPSGKTSGGEAVCKTTSGRTSSVCNDLDYDSAFDLLSAFALCNSEFLISTVHYRIEFKRLWNRNIKIGNMPWRLPGKLNFDEESLKKNDIFITYKDQIPLIYNSLLNLIENKFAPILPCNKILNFIVNCNNVVIKRYNDLYPQDYITLKHQTYYPFINSLRRLTLQTDDNSQPEVQSTSSYTTSSYTTSDPTRRSTRGPADSSFTEVHPAVSSSNYLSLKSKATPRDPGNIYSEEQTSSGQTGRTGNMSTPKNRELYPEEQKKSTRKNEEYQPLRTGILPGETKFINLEERNLVNRPQVETPSGQPVADLRELEGEVNKEGSTPSGKTSGETPSGRGGVTGTINDVINMDFDELVILYHIENIYRCFNKSHEINLKEAINMDGWLDEYMNGLVVDNYKNLDEKSIDYNKVMDFLNVNGFRCIDIANCIYIINDYSRFIDYNELDYNILSSLYNRLLHTSSYYNIDNIISILNFIVPKCLLLDNKHLPYLNEDNEFYNSTNNNFIYYKPNLSLISLFILKLDLNGMFLYTVSNHIQYSIIPLIYKLNEQQIINIIINIRHLLYPFYTLSRINNRSDFIWDLIYFNGLLNKRLDFFTNFNLLNDIKYNNSNLLTKAFNNIQWRHTFISFINVLKIFFNILSSHIKQLQLPIYNLFQITETKIMLNYCKIILNNLIISTPEIQSTFRSPAESSFNYLSLKSIATPGDRGEVNPEEQELPGRIKKMSTTKNREFYSEEQRMLTRNNVKYQPLRTKYVNPEEHTSNLVDVTSGGLPENDLREFEGDVIGGASTASGRQGALDIKWRADGRTTSGGAPCNGKDSWIVASDGIEVDWTSGGVDDISIEMLSRLFKHSSMEVMDDDIIQLYENYPSVLLNVLCELSCHDVIYKALKFIYDKLQYYSIERLISIVGPLIYLKNHYRQLDLENDEMIEYILQLIDISINIIINRFECIDFYDSRAKEFLLHDIKLNNAC